MKKILLKGVIIFLAVLFVMFLFVRWNKKKHYLQQEELLAVITASICMFRRHKSGLIKIKSVTRI